MTAEQVKSAASISPLPRTGEGPGVRALPRGWRWTTLGSICFIDKTVDGPVGGRIIGLEHIEAETGRIIDDDRDGNYSITVRFDERHVLYGKLRPYLNKVALPDFPGRCTTEILPLLPRDGCDREFLAWILRRPETVQAAIAEKTGTRMPRADIDQLLRLPIPLPPIPEQRRIVSMLRDQLEAVRRAREAALARREAARALPASLLRSTFESKQARDWPSIGLTDATAYLPARSIKTTGQTPVLTVTTACLTEQGFDPSGVKAAFMDSTDAIDAAVKPGEILIARSNTTELVGRVARYEGDPEGVVASDLTIRLWPTFIGADFLTAYLAFLYLTGYWQTTASGTSSSMKKITRTHLSRIYVPYPPSEIQSSVARRLANLMQQCRQLVASHQVEFNTIEALPQSILRRAFAPEH